jgi:hypothetical protein
MQSDKLGAVIVRGAEKHVGYGCLMERCGPEYCLILASHFGRIAQHSSGERGSTAAPTRTHAAPATIRPSHASRAAKGTSVPARRHARRTAPVTPGGARSATATALSRRTSSRELAAAALPCQTSCSS